MAVVGMSVACHCHAANYYVHPLSGVIFATPSPVGSYTLTQPGCEAPLVPPPTFLFWYQRVPVALSGCVAGLMIQAPSG